MAEKKRAPRPQRPQEWRNKLELIKRRYSRREAESIYWALRQLYELLLREKPDLVVWPLRGTWSFVKVVRYFASMDKRSSDLPRFVLPKIGQVHQEAALQEDRLKSERALSGQEKVALLVDALKKHEARLSKPGAKVMLVDEVLTGGAILKNHEYLQRALRRLALKPRVLTVAIEHAGRITPRYEQRARHLGIIRIPTARLFTVDKLQFMYPMTRRPAGTGPPSLVYHRKSFLGTMQLLEDIAEIHRRVQRTLRQRRRR